MNCEVSMKKQKVTGIVVLVCAVGASMYLWSDNQAAMQKEQANSSSPAPSATPSQQQPNELGWHVLVDQQTEPPPPPPPPPAPPAAPGRAPGAAPVGEPSPEPPRTLIGM